MRFIQFRHIALNPSHFDPIYVTVGQIEQGLAPKTIAIITISDHKKLPEHPVSERDDQLAQRTGYIRSPEPLPCSTEFNRDIALIPQIHPAFLINWNKKEANSRKVESIDSSPTNTRTSYSGVSDSLLMKGGSMIKAIALAKLLYLANTATDPAAFPIGYAPNKQRTVLCLGGHWILSANCEGDHAYPAANLERRYREYCTHTNSPPNNFNWHLIFMDAKNLMGLCKPCNLSKSNDWFGWIQSNRYLGPDYLSEILPLNSSGIVPRTRDGVGLGDSITLYFLNKVGNRRMVGISNKNPDEIIGLLKSLSLVDDHDLAKLAENKEVEELLLSLSTRLSKLNIKK